MNSHVEQIDPEKAAQYLQYSNPRNRVVPTLTRKYAKAMRAGMWALNHQGIAFDDSGMLIDGHNRLRAVIQSGVTIQMLVTRGVASDPLTMRGIDRGGTRTMHHIAQMVDGAPSRDAMECARLWMTVCFRQSGKAADHEVWDTAIMLQPHWDDVSEIKDLHTSSGRVRAGLRIGAIVANVEWPTAIGHFINDLVEASRRKKLGADGTRNLLRWLDNVPKVRGSSEFDVELTGAFLRGFDQFRSGGSHNHIKVVTAVAADAIRACDARLRVAPHLPVSLCDNNAAAS